MRRWWVTLALLLSLGINLGLLAAVAAGRWAGRPEAAEAPPPLAPPGGGRELPVATSIEVPAEPATEGEPAASPTRGAAGGEAGEASPADPDATAEEPGEGRRRRGGAAVRGIRHGHGGAHGHGGLPGEPPLGRLADHLGLAGEPRERFLALQREFLDSHLEARRERARLGIELRRELVAPEPDAARVEELLAGIGESYLASERATAAVILRSRELLDDDQREAYFRFLERLRHDGPHAGPAAGAGRERRRR